MNSARRRCGGKEPDVAGLLIGDVEEEGGPPESGEGAGVVEVGEEMGEEMEPPPPNNRRAVDPKIRVEIRRVFVNW